MGNKKLVMGLIAVIVAFAAFVAGQAYGIRGGTLPFENSGSQSKASGVPTMKRTLTESELLQVCGVPGKPPCHGQTHCAWFYNVQYGEWYQVCNIPD